ncbi:MAG: hypothetical protein RMY29_005035 [Nostoc sp. CreGUA01]|nr:hypothetical protein [Nostoc sp. CreGUA01]
MLQQSPSVCEFWSPPNGNITYCHSNYDKIFEEEYRIQNGLGRVFKLEIGEEETQRRGDAEMFLNEFSPCHRVS